MERFVPFDSPTSYLQRFLSLTKACKIPVKHCYDNRFIFEPLQKQTHFHVNEERSTLHNILFKRNCIRISHNWIISGIL